MAIEFGLEEIRTKNFWRAVAAEFVGMTMFLLCVSTVAIGWKEQCVNYPNGTCIIPPKGTSLKGLNVTTLDPDDGAAVNTEVSIGIGLAIASHAQAFGHVSGGHLNPAVTLGMIVGGNIAVLKGIFYILAQMVGAIAGSGIVYACTPTRFAEASNLGANALQNGTSVGGGFGVEILFTFMLVFFVFSVTDPRKRVEAYGQTLGIGVIIMVAHVCIIPYTNCSINPARSFGPAVVMNVWDDHWIFWIAPALGGISAAVLYKLVFFVDEDYD